MMGNKANLLICLFLLSCHSITHARTTPCIPHTHIKKIVLNNGMTFILCNNTTTPKVLVQMVYKVGSSAETFGKHGLAHLLEHMLFKGTHSTTCPKNTSLKASGLSESDITAIARKYGARHNAFTSMDITSYYFETTKNNWQPFVQILADTMQHARLDPQHLTSEIKAVIHELKMAHDNHTRMMLLKACELAYPAHHPYHVPVMGCTEDLFSITVDDLRTFYKKHYQPHNALLFIVGDIDFHETEEYLRTYFECIPTALPAPPRMFPHHQSPFTTNHTKWFHDVKKELLGCYWIIPGAKSSTYITAQATAFLLGNGRASRLHRALVDNHKVASSVTVHPFIFAESGLFFITIKPFKGTSEQCKNLIEDIMHTVYEKGFGKNELAHCVKIQQLRMFKTFNNLAIFTNNLIEKFLATGNEHAMLHTMQQYNSLTSRDVQQFIGRYLDPLSMHNIHILPTPKQLHALSTKIHTDKSARDAMLCKKQIRTQPSEQPKMIHMFPKPQPTTCTFPQPDHVVTLKNGLKIIMKKRIHTPLITIRCALNNADQQAGTLEEMRTDLMMSMLTEGRKKETRNFFGPHGASYTFNAHGAHITMPASDYKPLLKHFFNLLTKPVYKPKALEKLKKLHSEKVERKKDNAQAYAQRLLQILMYHDTRYGWSFNDLLTTIAKVTLTDIVHLHQQYITPTNTTVAVVGDFDLDDMQQTIEKVCGNWGNRQDTCARKTPFLRPFDASTGLSSKHLDSIRSTFRTEQATASRSLRANGSKHFDSIRSTFRTEPVERPLHKFDTVRPEPVEGPLHRTLHQPTKSILAHLPITKIDHFMARHDAVLLLGQPTSVTMHHSDWLALQLLNFICFGSLGSRLFDLRKEDGLFYNAFGSWAAHASRTQCYNYVGALISPHHAHYVERKMLKLIKNIATSGITQDELDDARQWFLKKLIDQTASNQSLARLFCSLESSGLGFDYYEKQLKRLQTLSLNEMNNVCNRLFSTDNMIRVRVGPI